ncbi:unnamed protein product [Didymodactylos carnosus]|uniref:Uncharacterized protein n=1 Tax=Didymodactylos carnosus TaxID=1234261 RepID=A0A8S2I5T7_9BILA|nr:unnamed protein product [Didymodactylos carnosus]CAF3720484.1 unnamed protein product [Didymodactylos carnosus]
MSTWDGVVPGDGTVIIIPPGIIVYIDDARLIVNLLQIQIYGQLQIGVNLFIYSGGRIRDLRKNRSGLNLYINSLITDYNGGRSITHGPSYFYFYIQINMFIGNITLGTIQDLIIYGAYTLVDTLNFQKRQPVCSFIMTQPRQMKIPFTNEEKVLMQRFYLQFGSKSSRKIAREMTNNSQVPVAIQQMYGIMELTKSAKRIYDHLTRETKSNQKAAMVKLAQHMPLTDPTQYFHHQQQKTPTSQQQSPQWQATQQDSRSHQAKHQNDENCVDEDEAIDINEDDKVFREIPSPSDPSDLN